MKQGNLAIARAGWAKRMSVEKRHALLPVPEVALCAKGSRRGIIRSSTYIHVHTASSIHLERYT